MLSSKRERILNPIRFGIQFRHGGVLRLTSSPPMEHDQFLGCVLCKFGARISFDESKSKIYPSGHARRCPKRTIGYEYASRRATTVQDVRLCQGKYAGTTRRDPFDIYQSHVGGSSE